MELRKIALLVLVVFFLGMTVWHALTFLDIVETGPHISLLLIGIAVLFILIKPQGTKPTT